MAARLFLGCENAAGPLRRVVRRQANILIVGAQVRRIGRMQRKEKDEETKVRYPDRAIVYRSFPERD